MNFYYIEIITAWAIITLWAVGIRYAMHFPSTLPVEYKGSKMSFHSPIEAFLNDLEVDSGESLMNWLREKRLVSLQWWRDCCYKRWNQESITLN